MPEFFSNILMTFSKVFQILFGSDNDVMSEDLKKILANPADAKKLKDAIIDMKNDEGRETRTIELSNHQQVTLTP